MAVKRLLLFNSPWINESVDHFQSGNLYPRIGVASIAAYVRENGHDVEILDPNISLKADIISRLKRFSPDFVGIPCYTQEFYDAVDTGVLVREICPNTKVVVGGSHVSALGPCSLKEGKSFDIAVVGEGEQVMLDILNAEDISEVKNVSYKKDGTILVNDTHSTVLDINKLPPPAWNLYELDKYKGVSLLAGFRRRGKSLELPVEGARGCPFSCHFCYKLNQNRITFKLVSKIIDEIKEAVNVFGADRIHFVEGTFGVNKRYSLELCQNLLESGLSEKVSWATSGNIKVLDEELLLSMKSAGCRFLGFGVETGSQQLLEKIGSKATSLERIKETFQLCKDIGIDTEACFIMGHPYETEDTIKETIKFAKSLNTKHANFAVMVPFPGTKIAQMAEDGVGGLKILSKDWRLYGKQVGLVMELEQLSNNRLRYWQEKAYRSFYLTPFRIGAFARLLTLKTFIGIIKRFCSNEQRL